MIFSVFYASVNYLFAKISIRMCSLYCIMEWNILDIKYFYIGTVFICISKQNIKL